MGLVLLEDSMMNLILITHYTISIKIYCIFSFIYGQGCANGKGYGMIPWVQPRAFVQILIWSLSDLEYFI